MTAAAGSSPVDRVWGVVDGFCTWAAARAVVELDLVGALAAGPVPTGALGVDAARVEPVLALLVSAGLLEHADDGWTLVDPGALLLVVRAPGPVDAWLRLADTVRTGQPTAAVDDDPVAFYGPLVAATAGPQRRVADAVVATLCLPAGAHVVDLGCGAAPWAGAVLDADPAARATCVDLAGVVEQAAALGERATLVPGGYLVVDLEPASADVVVLGQLLRAEPDERAAALVARAAAVVRPGGVVVVSEYLLDDDRLGPPSAVRMAATVAAGLRAGRSRTGAEVDALLADAGLAVVARHTHPPTDVVVAGRPEEP